MKFTKCSVPVTITLCEHPMTDGRTYINSPDLKGFRYVVEDSSDLAKLVTALTCFVDLKLRLGASADTRPKGGDALAAPFTSGAVPKADARTSMGNPIHPQSAIK